MLSRRRGLYLTNHNTQNRQKSMSPAGFEAAFTSSERRRPNPYTASDLHVLYCSINFMRVIKSRVIELAGHMVLYLWGTGEVYTDFWWENLRGVNHLEDLGVDGRIILIGSPSSRLEGNELDRSASEYRQMTVDCE